MKPFILQMDTSEVGLGSVLYQKVKGEELPILYVSRKLLPREVKYLMIEKEALALKRAIEALWYYLLGNSFLLITDHTPLWWLISMKVMRWYFSL